LIAFMFSRWLTGFTSLIDVLYAAGLILFAVTGAGKALELGVGPAQAIILGPITGVGGGTVRGVLLQRVPSVLSSGLYAIPALVGAALVVAADSGGVNNVLGVSVTLAAALVCFLIRVVGLHFDLDAPKPPGTGREGPQRQVMAVVSGRARRGRRRSAPGSRCPRWAGEGARRWPNG
jgi:uncharacterized membrane protein YeiH